MKFSERLECGALTVVCKVVGWLPERFLYGPFLDLLYWLLYRVFKYRVDVVHDNLTRAFPEKGAEEIAGIESRFYRHLAEIFVDTVDLVGISAGKLKRRMNFLNNDQLHEWMQGRDWIAAMAHYGSWEYFNVYPLVTESKVLGVYHPLKDRGFDAFYKKSRSRFGLTPVAVNLLLRTYMAGRKEGRPQVIGLIADQIPTLYNIDHWYEFFGRYTGFYSGMEKMALRFGIPVVFVDVTKTARARYEVRFEMLYDGHEEVGPHEITARYAACLEKMIRRCPELWMWSHRRWKHQPRPGWELNVKL